MIQEMCPGSAQPAISAGSPIGAPLPSSDDDSHAPSAPPAALVHGLSTLTVGGIGVAAAVRPPAGAAAQSAGAGAAGAGALTVFFCPLTGAVMRDPVVDRDGNRHANACSSRGDTLTGSDCCRW